MNSNQKILIIAGVALLVVLGMAAWFYQSNRQSSEVSNPDSSMTDAQKFASEYRNVSDDNLYEYATNQQILDIFEKGSGLVYFGFPECPWCQQFVPIINEAAKQEGLDKIYYFNIRDARTKNDETYQKIVDYLKEYLPKDEDGNPRISVPDVTAVKNGEIVGRYKQEPGSEGQNTPDTYWTNERQERAITQLQELIQKITTN